MASRKPMTNDQASLPFGALQLLAPPLRLVSAAVWKVMKERDVMQYGVVEEFVTSACDTVPGLLTLRHRARLTLGLRARLVLELCREQPDPKVIAVHMERIRVPVMPSSSSSLNMGRDFKIKSAVENAHSLIPKLLTDASEKEHFFKNVFPFAYGTKYDQELEKLLWEFLIRLDQLLPVPSLAQTASWLNDAPLILEECARAASQPQLLKILLQHQTCLGHLDPAASLPPNMGDGIISSLSLPPSGKEPSNVPSGSTSSNKTQFIKPVIGLICNDSVPLMMSISQRSQSSDMTNTNENNEQKLQTKTNVRYTEVKDKENIVDGIQAQRVSGKKWKKIDDCDSASDEEEIRRRTKSVKRRTNRNVVQTSDGEGKDIREMLQTSLQNIGYEMLLIPDDEFLCCKWFSCLKYRPTVIIEKLLLTSALDLDTNLTKPRTSLPVNAAVCGSVIGRRQRTMYCVSGSDNKENTPSLLRSRRPALRLKSNAGHEDVSAEMEDYVADSEDEASKNFKGRLFTKRYCKTKHGTFVPTLREYWKPYAERRNLLSPGSKQR